MLASRRERAGALRQFAGQLHAFQDRTLIGLQRLRLDLSDAYIDDEDRATFTTEFESAAEVLREALAVTFEEQRSRLAALAQALDSLGPEGDASCATGTGFVTSSSFRANLQRAKLNPAGSGYTGETINHGKEVFEVWSFAGLGPESVDWGADADFKNTFGTQSWKGRSADDYRELMAKTPALLVQCRTSGTTEVPSALALARDAYFGNDRVRLEIDNEGRVSIVNGRHRVMAAIECGATIPVSAWRAR